VQTSNFEPRRCAALCVKIMCGIAIVPMAWAQTVTELPVPREAEALRGAYGAYADRAYGQALDDYRTLTMNFSGTAVEPIARRGAFLSEVAIAIWGETGTPGSIRDATLLRIRSAALRDQAEQLFDDGLLSGEEHGFWMAFLNAEGDIDLLIEEGILVTPDTIVDVFAGRADAR